jgi:nucleotide-binding universal stress UspA family protein
MLYANALQREGEPSGVASWVEAMNTGMTRSQVVLGFSEAKVQQELDAHLTQIQEAGLQGDTVLVHGVPSQGILDTARDQHVDLIIMGTHGRTRAHQMLIGSVAQQVVPRAPCPILLLPRPADEIMMY